jgi:hypothetical protein
MPNIFNLFSHPSHNHNIITILKPPALTPVVYETIDTNPKGKIPPKFEVKAVKEKYPIPREIGVPERIQASSGFYLY